MTADRLATPARRVAITLWAAALVTASACSTPEEPLRSDLASPAAEVQACAKWFAAVDEAIDRAGVRDGEAYPIPGFPYLRASRFLASFRTDAQSSDAAFAAWEGHLRGLDARTREYELQNLSTQAFSALGVKTWTEAEVRSNDCGAVLMKADAASETRRRDLFARAQVPDDYSDWKRAVGIYPLARIPFFQFAKGWENDTSKLFEDSQAGKTPHHEIVRYRPAGESASARRIATVFANAKRDGLGIPQFSDRDADLLFTAFAPVIDVETTGNYDRIGLMRWGEREVPDVDASRPTVYRRLAFTRYGKETLVQVVYLLWFSERPDDSWFDPVSGKLDGLFFRVTLDSTGQPLVYDTIHPCGCYHMFFPTALISARPAPESGIEWAFVPRTLPAIELPQRVMIRVQTRTHYLMDIHPEAAGAKAGGTRYALLDDGVLRTLPSPAGPRSIYGPDGIVRGTERGERFVTWPLGLEEAGSMREWGRHATALIGRRQFDDADLIERRFSLGTVSETHASSR